MVATDAPRQNATGDHRSITIRYVFKQLYVMEEVYLTAATYACVSGVRRRNTVSETRRTS